MKLKYKKLVVMVSMCTMGIGLVTFSISRPSDKSTTVVEGSNEDAVKFRAGLDADISSAEIQSAAIFPSTALTPTPAEEPQTQDDLMVVKSEPLEKDAYKNINKLIKNYLNAKLGKDIDKFKPLVNDVSLIDLADIERKTKYIEAYKNVTCYTKKGPEEGSFIVYAYHEVKFTSIDTLAPAMNEFYVNTDEKGNPYIYVGEVDKDTEKYFNDVRDSDEVMDLIFDVNEKLQLARNNDSGLDEFYLKLEESAKTVTMNN
ncbi:MAG: hypothetical protein WCD89_09655 [Anaerocolumna sp.]